MHMIHKASKLLSLPHRRLQLANGLQVVLHHDDDLPLVAVNLWYHVGSKNERPGGTGFAHLFEHMLFQGSANVGANDHFRYIQQVGGIANGSTWYDRTNYYETVPSHHLGLALWLEADRMGFLLPAMTDEKLENQRSVVMNERRQRIDNQPYGRATERLNELLFPADHPYHWPVIGTMEDIAAATMEDIHRFFETYYRPSNAVLTIAGSFDEAEAMTLVEQYFGGLETGPPPPPPELPAVGLSESRRETLEDRVQLSRLFFGFHAPAYGHSDWYAGDVLTSILTRGKASRLYDDLVYRREIARSIGAWILPTEATSVLSITATISPSSDPKTVEAAILEQCAEIARSGPTEEELERAKRYLRTALLSSLQGLAGRADLLSQATTFFDDPGFAAGELGRYEAVGAEDIARFARQLIVEASGVTITVVPESPE